MCDEIEATHADTEQEPAVSVTDLAQALCAVARRPLPAQARVERVERYTLSELRLRVCFEQASTHRLTASTLGTEWQEHLGCFDELLARSHATWQRPFDPAPEIRAIAREIIDREECRHGRRAESVELHVRTEELIFLQFSTPRERETRFMATYPPRLEWKSQRPLPWYQQMLGLRPRRGELSSEGRREGEE